MEEPLIRFSRVITSRGLYGGFGSIKTQLFGRDGWAGGVFLDGLVQKGQEYLGTGEVRHP